MALFNCSECNNEISNLANACPNCGAPIIKVQKTPLTIKAQNTWPIIWVILVVIVLGVFVLSQSRSFQEQSLPQLPIEVEFRGALLGNGLVLRVKNTSNEIITTLVSLKNPTMQQESSYRLDIPAHGFSEIGHLEGWVLAHGDIIKIYNEAYKSWNGSIP